MNPFAWRGRAGSRPEVEAQIDEELGFHLERSQRELETGGASPAEAEAAARERFGNFARVRWECLQIANGEQTMIKNILLAASLVVIVTLSLMCVHFYNVARAAKQDAIMQRMLLVQEMEKGQAMQGFLQNLLVAEAPRESHGRLSLVPLLQEVGSAINGGNFAPEVEDQLRAATRAATQNGELQDDQ